MNTTFLLRQVSDCYSPAKVTAHRDLARAQAALACSIAAGIHKNQLFEGLLDFAESEMYDVINRKNPDDSIEYIHSLVVRLMVAKGPEWLMEWASGGYDYSIHEVPLDSFMEILNKHPIDTVDNLPIESCIQTGHSKYPVKGLNVVLKSQGDVAGPVVSIKAEEVVMAEYCTYYEAWLVGGYRLKFDTNTLLD